MIEFLASIPMVASAVRVHGDGSLRLTLEVPESEMPSALGVLSMLSEPLRVTIAVDRGPEQ